jgi:UDP-N-acetyl-D-galactosamine dehydrogenase
MGITFKEDVTDIRNSKVVDVIKELNDFGISVDVIDPGADPEHVKKEYGFNLQDKPSGIYDSIIIAVSHKEYHSLNEEYFSRYLTKNGIVVDVKGIFRGKITKHSYWSL